MSDNVENLDNNTNQEVVEQKPKELEFNLEDAAKSKGWKPKEEYEGDPTRWKSAEVFLALEEPIQKIEALAKELKEQKKANQMLIEHHHKVKESEFTRALEFLKLQKKEAFEKGNVDKILEIDEQIDLVKETQRNQKQAVQQKPEQPEIHPDFQKWVNNNSWYSSDTELRVTADSIGLAYAQLNANKTPQEVLQHVEKEIRRIYPDKFVNPKRNIPNGMETPNNSGESTDKFELTEEQRRVMNTFIRAGIMTKDEYIKEIRGIK